MRALAGLLAAAVLGCGVAQAAPQAKIVESEIDPKVFEIDQTRFIGVRPDPSLPLVDQDGRPFTLGDALGKDAGVPLVVVLSYYQCDGTCSAVNGYFRDLLAELPDLRPGVDFKALTLSFDRTDTLATLRHFRDGVRIPAAVEPHWTWSLAERGDDIRRFTDTLGFTFFWSAQDRAFFHPGVFVVLTPEGRVSRYLYAFAAEAPDLRLALTEARGERIGTTPRDLINYATLLCYSYNYKDGRYALNIPLFVGLGSLSLGIVGFSGAAVAFRRRRLREGPS